VPQSCSVLHAHEVWTTWEVQQSSFSQSNSMRCATVALSSSWSWSVNNMRGATVFILTKCQQHERCHSLDQLFILAELEQHERCHSLAQLLSLCRTVHISSTSSSVIAFIAAVG
jgi:hypothetical protein